MENGFLTSIFRLGRALALSLLSTFPPILPISHLLIGLNKLKQKDISEKCPYIFKKFPNSFLPSYVKMDSG